MRLTPLIRYVRYQSTRSNEEKFAQILKNANTSKPVSPKPLALATSIPPHIETLASIWKQDPNLPSNQEKVRNKITKTVSDYFESFQQMVLKATTTLNDVTGYLAIDQLRKDIDTLENELKNAKTKVTTARQQYSDAINQRSNLQKEINELLTRKHNWNPEDLERFTELYRNDHGNEQRETESQAKLREWENYADSVQTKLSQLIANRYHEEQIWSDKIRRASTWGTWIIMGFNVLLFFVATFIVEPWKRRRMVDSFENKVKLAFAEFGNSPKETLTDTMIPQNDPRPHNAYFTLPIGTWNEFRQALVSNCKNMLNSSVETVTFNKIQLEWLMGIMCIISGSVASLITIYCL